MKPSFRSVLLSLVVALAAPLAPVLHAQDGPDAAQNVPHPSLAGQWKLDVSKSNYGKNGKAPASELDVINQSGDDITVAVSQVNGTVATKYSYKVHAGAAETAVAQDQYGADDVVRIQSVKAVWAADSLVVTLNATFKKDPVTLVVHYTLSPDGSRLTKVSNIDRDAGKLYTIEIFGRD